MEEKFRTLNFNPGSATQQLCDQEQVGSLICASVLSPIRNEGIY